MGFSANNIPIVDGKGRKSCDEGMSFSADGLYCLPQLDASTLDTSNIPMNDGRGHVTCTDGFVLNAQGFCQDPQVRMGTSVVSSAPPAPPAEDPRLRVSEGDDGLSLGAKVAIGAGILFGLAPVAFVAARHREAISGFLSDRFRKVEVPVQPAANDNAEPAKVAANDNAIAVPATAEPDAPAVINAEDLPVDLRAMVRDQILSLEAPNRLPSFKLERDDHLEMLTDKVLARWNEVPASTREALQLWEGDGQWRQSNPAEPIPSRWLQMAIQEVRDRQPSFDLAAYQHGAEARVVRFTPDGPSLEKEVAIPVSHASNGSETITFIDHSDVEAALKDFAWYQRLPKDARERVVDAVAAGADGRSSATHTAVVMTIGEMATAMERGGVPVEVQILPSFPREGDALPLPGVAEAKRPLPPFQIEDDIPRFATADEEARLVAETEAKLAGMRLFKQRGPEGRAQDAARYLERWQQLSERERASFTRVAEGMGEKCHVGSFDFPPVTWLSSEASRDIAKVARRVQQINGEGMNIRDAREMAERAFINRDRAPSYMREWFGEAPPADPVNAATLSMELNIPEADAEALLRNEAFKPFMDETRAEWGRLSADERRAYANQEVRFVARKVGESVQQRGLQVAELAKDGRDKDEKRNERKQGRGAAVAVELPHVK